ncbi:MAG TPA: hypothetical protein PLY16_01015, partial [Candidatus Saccharibacteria bacterium]|nr:hypothetical protein [Candidatus Saccharibacteria bacterium]
MESYNRKSKKVVKISVLVVVIIALLGALGFFVWQHYKPVENTNDQSSQQEQEAVENGTITGSLTYPSSNIPDDFVVYAHNIETDTLSGATNDHLTGEQYQYGVGYSLEVEPGRYYVYGELASNPEQKAYYNQFILCGMMASCTD